MTNYYVFRFDWSMPSCKKVSAINEWWPRTQIRLDEFVPLIITNEHVANGIINANCTGVKFIPVSEFKS